MLDAAKLATLRAVVEHGSLSAAARARSLTQPAVSRQIALLEAQLRTQLLERSRQGVRATPAGRLLAEHAAAVERRLARAEREVAMLARGGATVRLGSFFTAFAQLTPELEAAAERALPAVAFEHELIDRASALDRIAHGALDAAVVFEHPGLPSPPPPAGVRLVPLFCDPARVLLPARHPLARRRSLRVADLAGATWISAPDGGAAAVLAQLRAGVPGGTLRAGRGEEPVEGQVYVAAGAGVMLAWELNVIVNRGEIAVRPLRDAPARNILAAHAEEPDAATLAVVELLRGLRPQHG